MDAFTIIGIIEERLKTEEALTRDLFSTMASLYDDGVSPAEPEFLELEESYQRATGALQCLKSLVKDIEEEIRRDLDDMAREGNK